MAELLWSRNGVYLTTRVIICGKRQTMALRAVSDRSRRSNYRHIMLNSYLTSIQVTFRGRRTLAGPDLVEGNRLSIFLTTVMSSS